MLLGMIRPTTGHAELLGEPVRPDATRLWRRVGHLVESATAYPELTVRENLEVARRLAGVADRRKGRRLIERAGTRAIRRAAGRNALARKPPAPGAGAGAAAEPELLVLDEPANGLDPAGVIEIRELIRRLAGERGATIFMSSHILAEVERLATRIGIVHRGRLVEELDAEALERQARPAARDRGTRRGAAERALRDAGLSPTRAGTNGQWAARAARAPRARRARRDRQLLVSAGVPPLHLAIARESLEEHFIRLTSAVDARAAA